MMGVRGVVGSGVGVVGVKGWGGRGQGLGVERVKGWGDRGQRGSGGQGVG